MTYPTKKLGEVLEKVPKLIGVLTKSYQGDGEFPIIDQGQSLIAGYTDNVDSVYKGELPVIIFGDHTRAIKFIDFRFAVGADGTKILKPVPELDPKYFYYFLQSTELPARGYARHFKILKELRIPLPPVGEQRRIVEQIERQFKKIDEAAHLRAENQQRTATFLPAALHEIFSSSEWKKVNVTEIFEKVPVGKQWSKKESSPTGAVPIIDQSQDGIFAYHNEKPNIVASEDAPIVTFANHTTAVRFITFDFSVIQNVFPLRAKEGVFPRYLYYAIQGLVKPDGYKGHWPQFVQKEIPLPPLSEQKAIVKKLDALAAKTKHLQSLQTSQSQALKSLKQSILHEAFTV